MHRKKILRRRLYILFFLTKHRIPYKWEMKEKKMKIINKKYFSHVDSRTTTNKSGSQALNLRRYKIVMLISSIYIVYIQRLQKSICIYTHTRYIQLLNCMYTHTRYIQ